MLQLAKKNNFGLTAKLFLNGGEILVTWIINNIFPHARSINNKGMSNIRIIKVHYIGKRSAAVKPGKYDFININVVSLT